MVSNKSGAVWGREQSRNDAAMMHFRLLIKFEDGMNTGPIGSIFIGYGLSLLAVVDALFSILTFLSSDLICFATADAATGTAAEILGVEHWKSFPVNALYSVFDFRSSATAVFIATLVAF